MLTTCIILGSGLGLFGGNVSGHFIARRFGVPDDSGAPSPLFEIVPWMSYLGCGAGCIAGGAAAHVNLALAIVILTAVAPAIIAVVVTTAVAAPLIGTAFSNCAARFSEHLVHLTAPGPNKLQKRIDELEETLRKMESITKNGTQVSRLPAPVNSEIETDW